MNSYYLITTYCTQIFGSICMAMHTNSLTHTYTVASVCVCQLCVVANATSSIAESVSLVLSHNSGAKNFNCIGRFRTIVYIASWGKINQIFLP